MIHSISANDSRFKTVTLHVGINVIVADTTDKSSSQDTRNGVGKTLLMDIALLLGWISTAHRRLDLPSLDRLGLYGRS